MKALYAAHRGACSFSLEGLRMNRTSPRGFVTVGTLMLILVACMATAVGDRPESRERFFNGRQIHCVGVVHLRVTAYSPDEQSCGRFADGITASGFSVRTNAGHLVAADTTVFPFGTLLSIPGYAHSTVVPVLDRGSAIQGLRADVFFPTHEEALAWGVRVVEVDVWGYLDGRGLDFHRP